MNNPKLVRTDFPANFMWGAATSAFQIEGATTTDGRGLSIWDTFSKLPNHIKNGDTADTACDHYHRYKDDVALMSGLGLRAYRFSVSWPRVLPLGRGQVNQAGLDFYDRLVDELLANGIEPYATLYHWDLPQALEDKGGWTKRETAQAFAEYADTVSRRLGDRVKSWMTFNEPFVTAIVGYMAGAFAPGRKGGANGVAAVHHQLLAHGLALPVLRGNLRRPDAEVGIALSLDYSEPANSSHAAHEAARLMDAYVNKLFLDPLYKGSYPTELWNQLEPLLLPFQPNDMAIISTPMDFLGFNYYTRNLQLEVESFQEMHLKTKVVDTGNATSATALGIYPQGLYQLLKRLTTDYPVKKLYITENGYCDQDQLEETTQGSVVHDPARINYLTKHITAAKEAVQAGVPLAGYFVWSLLDNFEWLHGYEPRLGLIYVDYPTQRRIPKDSALWYQQFLRS